MSQIFSYRSREADLNESQLFKSSLSLPQYSIDFADGMGTATISTASTGAVNASNSFSTASCVGTTAIASTVVSQHLLTCGTSGTAAAIDGARFKVTTTATLSNGSVLTYAVYVLVQAASYDPD